MGRIGILTGLVLVYVSSAMAQGVQGVRPTAAPLEFSAGYTFVSFNEIPTPSTVTKNSGFDGSAVYYYNFVGFEGDFSDAFGSSNGQSTSVLFGGGGIRARWPNAQSFQPWIHALIGASHMTPQIALGKDTAFGSKLGGGVDLYPHNSRLGFRVSADLFATHYFGTYQLSPEVTAGVVFSLNRE